MSTAIAIRPAASSLEELQTLGQVFVRSGFFADTKEAAQAMVKVMAGQELGFPPIASMTGVYIVKGKVSLSANLMAAAIKRSGKYNFKVRELTPEVCRIEFFENGEKIGDSEFTMREAKAGKLDQDWKDGQWKDKATWKNFPRNMLYARAMSNGCKWYCPDIFGGPVYTPEELGATVNEEGDVIDVEPLSQAAAAPATEQQQQPKKGDSGKLRQNTTPTEPLSEEEQQINQVLIDAFSAQKGDKNGPAFFAQIWAGKPLAERRAKAQEFGYKGIPASEQTIDAPVIEDSEERHLLLADIEDLFTALKDDFNRTDAQIATEVARQTGGEAEIERLDVETLASLKQGLTLWIQQLRKS